MTTRLWLALVPPTWSSHVVKSCTIRDRRDGVSVGAGGVCAWTSAIPENRKKREKLLVINILSFLIITPPTQHAGKTFAGD